MNATWNYTRYLIKSDLYRYIGRTSYKDFLHELSTRPGFQYSFWMRICAYLSAKKSSIFKMMFIVSRIFLRHYRYKYQIDIPYTTSIGPGLCIAHFSAIIVSPETKIGKNLTIFQGVTIGKAARGRRAGAPIIGNNVYVAPGAKIFGKIVIGDNVVVGANSVVPKNIENNAVVGGVPMRVLSYKGADGYVNRTDYPQWTDLASSP